MSQEFLQNSIAKKQIYNIEADVPSPNNSLVFSWKESPRNNYPLEWYEISISPGDYTIDEINDKFTDKIKNITNKNYSNIIISSMKNNKFSSITITSPDYIVDIYNSSIRTVLGWPKDERFSKQFSPKLLKWNNSIYGDGVHFFQ